jgi:hypothetical protein
MLNINGNTAINEVQYNGTSINVFLSGQSNAQLLNSLNYTHSVPQRQWIWSKNCNGTPALCNNIIEERNVNGIHYGFKFDVPWLGNGVYSLYVCCGFCARNENPRSNTYMEMFVTADKRVGDTWGGFQGKLLAVNCYAAPNKTALTGFLISTAPGYSITSDTSVSNSGWTERIALLANYWNEYTGQNYDSFAAVYYMFQPV